MGTTTNGKRTAGEFAYENGTLYVEDAGTVANFTDDLVGNDANGRTCALALTAANAVDAMGLDGDAAVRELPSLIGALDSLALWIARAIANDAFGDHVAPSLAESALTDARALLARLRPADETKEG